MIKEGNKGERGTEKRCFKRVVTKVHQISMKAVDTESTALLILTNMFFFFWYCCCFVGNCNGDATWLLKILGEMKETEDGGCQGLN